MASIWRETADFPAFLPLEGDARTRVLIVGGGITGILCCYHLAKAGADCMLLETDRLCGGTTQNTTAKITAQHGLIYHRLIKNKGREAAGLYLAANLDALEEYRRLCREVDCDFHEEDSFVYARKDRGPLERETAALKELGFPARLVKDTALPFPVAGAVRFPGQARFHPLRFLASIAKGLPIHEGTRVLELMPGAAVTHHGTVRAEKIIIATRFPIRGIHGGYFLKLYQQRSYLLALRGAGAVGGMYIGEEDGKSTLSFRDLKGLAAGGAYPGEKDGEGRFSLRGSEDLLLLGGGGHRTGKKGGGWGPLLAFARKYWPGAEEVSRWAAQDCVTLDGMPYIGEYSGGTKGLYAAAGFGKWGMTSAMVSARLLTDLVLGKASPYKRLFDPSRGMLHKQLAVNALESTAGLLTPTLPRCPHLGCALKYNPRERSWDCPCHGSRFGEDGKLLDGPATDDLRHPPGKR